MTSDNLTELELAALPPNVINLSDGHARQSIGGNSHRRMREIFDAFVSSRACRDYFRSERRFLDALTPHTGQRYSTGQFFMTYASSVAMGVVATHLKRSGRRVGVMCPTFDNVPGILATLDIPLVPVAEKRFDSGCDLDYLSSLDLGALLFVMPNNPTGVCLSRAAMCDLFDWAARRDVQLIIDLAFRWFTNGLRWDILGEAEQRGADVITIDDTGKVLSLDDLKVSVISASHGLVAQIREIQTQYVLNVSELTLRLLTVMLDPSRADNEIAEAIRIVRTNRRYLHNRLDLYGDNGHVRSATPASSSMSVEWLSFTDNHRTEVVEECRRRGLEILIGDHFHWASELDAAGKDVRLALMRDPDYFAKGVDIFAEIVNGRLRG